MALQIKSSNEHIYHTEKKDGISTENWMSLLPDSLQHLPLSKLAIPGTHNSGTFTNYTTLAPDANGCLRCLIKIPLVGSCVKNILLRWTQCQKLDFTEQLLAGIRYFDLRVVATAGSEAKDFYLVHALLGPKVSDLVEAVLAFLETHSHEVVLLDFNHFYCMEMRDHIHLIRYLISKMGSKICSTCDIKELTLHNLWQQGKQVIIFYQNEAAQYFEEVWSAGRIASPWADTDKPENCIDFLSHCYTKPPARDFIV